MKPFQNLILSTKNVDEFISDVAEEVVRKLIDRGIVKNESQLPTPPATRKDAALHLGVSLPTLDALIKTGQLKSFKIGKQIRINWNDLESFLNKKGMT